MSQSFKEYEAIHRNLRAVRELHKPLTVEKDPWWFRLLNYLFGVR